VGAIKDSEVYTQEMVSGVNGNTNEQAKELQLYGLEGPTGAPLEGRRF
jgi:hypothetical protein